MKTEKTLSLTAFAFVLLFCNEDNSLIVKPKKTASLLESGKKKKTEDSKHHKSEKEANSKNSLMADAPL